nr:MULTISPECIES: aldehyde dehydrogenase family protein [unclassified Roseitalea]
MTPIIDERLSAAAKAFLERPKALFIDGDFVTAKDGKTFATEDPATGRTIVEVAEAGAADVDAAVAAARSAFDGVWRDMAPAGRAALMARLADLVNANLEELAELEALDTGKPVSMARALDIPFAAEIYRYYAGWATKLEGRSYNLALQGDPFHCYTLRQPLGVAAGIIPWNYPFAQASFKIAPALAAGCTVLLKPAEQTPLTALRLAELVAEAGFPKGVVNVLTGFGETAGAAITAHRGVDKVSFTGSTEIGKKIAQAATGNLKRVTLELGGKSPNVIFADADLDEAIPAAAMAIFGNSGQVCNAGSRLYVERSAFDKVMAGIEQVAANLKVGPGLDPNSEIGPLMSEAQQRRVTDFVEQGKRDGAHVAVGGARIGNSGYFMQPTVLTGTTPDMAVHTEEIFGPVLCAMPFDDPDKIPSVANDTRFGLAASIWTRDLSRAHRLARSINAGAIWINCFGVFDPNLPFGGMRESGWGREMAREGVEAFTEQKAVTIRL